MLRRVALIALSSLAVTCGSAAACWMHVSLDKLAGQSDAIVVGRLGSIRKVGPPPLPPLSRFHWYEAKIEVERALWPERRTAKTVTLRWSTSGMSTDIHYDQYRGVRALWLLERGRLPLSGYQANYPGRMVPLSIVEVVRMRRDEVRRAAPKEIRAQRVLKVLEEELAELEPDRG